MEFPTGFLTHFERTGFLESPNYDETMKYFAQFESTGKAEMFTFGISPQERELKFLVVSNNGEFSPQDARASGKVVVLIQNGIHAGEIEGKDACMLMLREMLIERTLAHLLENMVLLVIPILNVDGHERTSPFNRPNQNGPMSMGWRTTSWNLNLNRDYMKADAPEMKALLRLYGVWQPDFFIDNHTTNGADFQYHILYGVESSAHVEHHLREWAQGKLIPQITQRVEAQGFLTAPYFELCGDRLNEGVQSEPAFPRYSSGYAAAQNRLLLLVETHSLKPFANRVASTKAMNIAALECVHAEFKGLKQVNYYADSHTVHHYRHERKPFPLVIEQSDEYEILSFKGFESTEEESNILGATVVRYSNTPTEFDVKFFSKGEVEIDVDVPFGYAVPREYGALAEILALHGIEYKQLQEADAVTVERYRLIDVEISPRPYEGRQRVQCGIEKFTESVVLPVGTFIVYTQQRSLRVIMHLLEPQSPDSFMSWGFFNAFLERKEYAESYVMEPIARKMLENDPKLRVEFEEKLASDEQFASDPGLRLDFFYRRSPYFDKGERVYPIMRLPHKE